MSLPFIDYLLLTKGFSGGVAPTNPNLYMWGSDTSGFLGDGGGTSYYSWSQIATGGGHTIALRSDKTLWAWGKNDVGQVGDGTTINRNSPVSISATTSKWLSVTAGESHSVALDTGYNVYAWGGNRYGQLGFNDTVNRSAVTFLVGTTKQVKAGENHTIAISSVNTLYAWGFNGFGQLGDGTTINKSAYTLIGTSSWTSISAGKNHSVAIDINGMLYVWGDNTYGQLGDSVIVTDGIPVTYGTNVQVTRSQPTQIGNSSWSSVSAGGSHTAAIDVNSSLYTWGYDFDGQLGIDRDSTATYFTQIKDGGDHLIALRNDNTLWAWGRNTYGQLGDNTTLNRSSPVQIAGTWSDVSGGSSYTVAINTAGQIFAWGLNSSYQYGDGTTISRSSPVQITTGTVSWSQVSAGDVHTLALASDKSLWAWGTNTAGVVGGTANTLATSWTKIVSGDQHSLGIKANGTLWAWGNNTSGQLGIGLTTFRSSPVQIGTSTYTDIAVGLNHSLAIRNDGKLFAWGLNSTGQLGIYSWAQISTGASHTLLLRSDGIVWSYGLGTSGQLGNSAATNRSSPVQVGTNSYRLVSAGINTSAGITTDYRLFTWGLNSAGQLGDSTTVNKTAPTQILGSWNLVSAADYMLATDSTGLLYSWGTNTNGQLGQNNVVSTSSPVLVGNPPVTYSVYSVNNTLSYLSVPASSDFAYGADWTVEFWFFGEDIASAGLFGTTTGSTLGGLSITFAAGATPVMRIQTDNQILFTVATFTNNTWYHIAIQASSGNLSVYVNGTATTFTGSGSTSAFNITTTSGDLVIYNRSNSPTASLNPGGYITNLRITKGVTVYTGNFIVPQAPLTLTQSAGTNISAITSGQVILLTCNATTIVDSSTYARAINNVGGVTVNTFIAPELGYNVVGGVPITATKLSTGTASAVITPLGELYTWGLNTSGQLGLNDIVSRSSPTQTGTGSWTSVASSITGHTLGIKTDGSLWSWGLNSSSELGLGTSLYNNDNNNRSMPTQIGSSSWTSVSAGAYYSMATDASNSLYVWGNNSFGQLGIVNPLSWTITNRNILHSDGTLWLWGINNNGQLGQNDTINRSSPVQVAGSWISTSINNANSVIGIKPDYTMWAWGLNSAGQLGDGSTINKSSPVQIGGSWSAVSNSGTHALGIKANGTLWAWGLNSAGQLGVNDTLNRSEPVQVDSGIWTSVYAALGSPSHSFALKNDGTLWAFGQNNYGQLGLGTTINRSQPVQLAGSWTSIAAGTLFSVGINNLGQLYTWGYNNAGALGLGLASTTNRSSPVQVGTSSWTQIAAIHQSAYGLTIAGTLWSWGNGTNGELGNIASINRSAPVQVGALTTWNQIGGIAQYGAIATQTDGKAYVWGYNANGEIGDGTTVLKNSPVQLGTTMYTMLNYPTLYGTSSFTLVSAGASTATFKNSFDGFAYTAGAASVGQLGNNTTIGRSTPTQVLVTMNQANTSSPVQIGSDSWISIGAGNSHSIGVTSDSRLYTWGDNTYGQLGADTSLTVSTIKNIVGSWSVVSAGGYGSTAIKTDGSLFTWGNNDNGQLGVPGIGFTTRSSPVQVNAIGSSVSFVQASMGVDAGYAVDSNSTLYYWGYPFKDGSVYAGPAAMGSGYSSVMSGYSFAVAVKTNGTAFAWGDNTYGQLGQNDTVTRSAPTQISGSYSILGTGLYATHLSAPGAALVVGRNNAGQLGDNSTLNRSSPVMIYAATQAIFSTPVRVGTSSWTQVAAGYTHSVALRTDGGVFTWGLGTSGQLGQGLGLVASSRSSPVQVGALSYTQVAASKDTTGALRLDKTAWAWGLNSSGQMGDSTTLARSAPVQVGTGYYWNDIEVGPSHTVAIREDRTVWAWGNNSFGALGASDKLNRSSPVQMGTYRFNQITATTNLTGLIDPYGNILTVGDNTYGQIGNNKLFHSWTQLSNGNLFSAALRDDNQLWVWGSNLAGQLGDGTTIARSSPVQVAGSWSSISAGQSHMTAIKFDNTLWAWGLGTSGQLGNNLLASASSPVQLGASLGVNDFSVLMTSSNYMTITTDMSVIRTNSYTFETWINPVASGTQAFFRYTTRLGAVNNNAFTVTSSNTFDLNGISFGSATLPVGVWTHIALVRTTTSVDTNSTTNLYINGVYSGTVTEQNKDMELLGSFTVGYAAGITSNAYFSNTRFTSTIVYTGNFTVPTSALAATQSAGTNINAITAGQTLLLVCQKAINVDSSGRNSSFTGGTAVSTNSPFSSGTMNNEQWTKVSAGLTNTFAIRDNGTLWATGSGTLSGIPGDITTKLSMTQVGTVSNWSQVSTGASHTLLLNSNNELYGFGSTLLGQLGVNQYFEPISLAAPASNLAAMIKKDGSLWTWGSGTDGGLGDGTTTTRQSAIQIGNSSWAFVTTGRETLSMYAIDKTGALWAWGNNLGGQLGLGDTINRSYPTQIISAYSWTSVAAGFSFAIGLTTDNKLFTWGTNGSGRLGLGDVVSRSAPTQITSINTSWTYITAGSSNGMAIDATGTLFGWGANPGGLLGDGTTVSKSNPVQIGNSFVTVKSGASHTIAIKSDGKIYGTGDNTSGQLGSGTTVGRSTFSIISALSGISFTQLGAGAIYSAALDTTGKVWTWGSNDRGQLGVGDSINRSSPMQIGLPDPITKLYLNSSTLGGTLLALPDNITRMYVWGMAASASAPGVVGFTSYPTVVSTNEQLIKQPTKIADNSWSQISAGYSHSAAITTDGKLFTWGRGVEGQLGLKFSFAQINAGATGASAIRSDGSLWTWGANISGQLGDNTSVAKSSPVTLTSTFAYNSWVKVSSGIDAKYAIQDNGTLWAWGNGGSGQLGQLDVLLRSVPVQIGSSSWSQVAGGNGNMFGITVDGKLFGIGGNAFGQLGTNDQNSRSSPVQIDSGNSYNFVAAGNQYIIAKRTNSTLWGLGDNTYGQLGVTLGSFSWTKVSSGYSHTVGLRSDGSVWSWGVNVSGQLGNGTTISQSSPVFVDTSNSYVDVVAGGNSSYILRNDYTLWSFGLNSQFGQLGISDSVDRSSPVQVSGSWNQVAASISHVVAKASDGTLWSWGANVGQYGYYIPSNLYRSIPVQISSSSWTSISTGTSNIMGIKNSSLYGIGQNYNQQLGIQTTSTDYSMGIIATNYDIAGENTAMAGVRTDGKLFSWGSNNPAGNFLLDGTINVSYSPVQLGSESWVHIARAISHTVAIKADGTLWAWGLNNVGQLGLGDTIDRSSPTQVGTSSWYMVHAASDVTMGVYTPSAASVFMWGKNNFGQLGTNDTLNRSSPTQIGVTTWYGRFHTNGSSSGAYDYAGNTNKIWVWGNNANGQLGQNDRVNRSNPTQILTGSSWTPKFTASSLVFCTPAGLLFTCGQNNYGQLGNGTTIDRSSPVQVSSTASGDYTTGATHVLYTGATGTLWAFGRNNVGQLGNATLINRSAPVQITSGSVTFSYPTMANLTNSQTSMVKQGSTILVWGDNSSGQFGFTNNNISTSSPVVVSVNNFPFYPEFTLVDNTNSWTAVSAGNFHGLGITSTNNLYAWGSNTYGQIGDNSTITRSTPVQILAGSSWVKINASNTQYSHAIRQDGLLFAWGLNTNNQLGLTDAINRSSPVQIGTSSWTQVNAMNLTTSGIAVNNLYGWGYNGSGQIGNNSTANQATPIQVGTTTQTVAYSPVQIPGSWSLVAAHYFSQHTIAVKDNLLYTWGLNTVGQLGTNDTISRSSPVQVSGGLSNVIQIGVGGSATAALLSDNNLYTWGDNQFGQLNIGSVANRSVPGTIGTQVANGASLYFDGNGDFLRVSSATMPTSEDFTIELWFFLDGPMVWTTGSVYFTRLFSGIGTGTMEIYFTGSTTTPSTISVGSYNSAAFGMAGNINTSTALNTWHHVAISRSGSSFALWYDGVRIATATSTNIFTSSYVSLAGDSSAAAGYLGYLKGYISNARIVKGAVIYNPSSATITVPTTPLTAVANTHVLLAQDYSSIIDNSGNAYAVTVFGNTKTSVISPFATSTLFKNIAVADGLMLGVTTDDTLYAWGLNTSGQLGDNTTVNKSTLTRVASISIPSLSSPVQVGTDSWTSVGTGNNLTIAENLDGTLYAWGVGTSGDLGIGDTLNRSNPVQINTNTNTLFSVGATHATASSDSYPQVLYAWGLNSAGQLTDGTVVARSSPVQVATYSLQENKSSPVQITASDYTNLYSNSPNQVGTSSWSQASAGYKHTMGVTVTGTAFGWGNNSNGNLGDNTTINRSTPAQIGNAIAVSAGNNFTMTITSDGTAYGFGNNDNGQLGDGT